MRYLDTITITDKGRVRLPASWCKEAGLLNGGMCVVRKLDDGRHSLIITPHSPKRRGAVGLLVHLKKREFPFPKVERHILPFK